MVRGYPFKNISPYPLTLGHLYLYLIAMLMQWLLGLFFIESLFLGRMVGDTIRSLLYLT